jgi:hypothetical protein
LPPRWFAVSAVARRRLVVEHRPAASSSCLTGRHQVVALARAVAAPAPHLRVAPGAGHRRAPQTGPARPRPPVAAGASSPARAGGSGSATGSSARWTWSRSGSWRPRRPRSCTPWRRRLQNPSRDGYHCHELEVRGGTDVWIPQGRAAHRAAHRSTRRPPPLGVAHRSRPRRCDRQWPAEAGVRLRGGPGSPAAPAGRLAQEAVRYRGRASLATVEVGAERRHCVPGRPRQPGHRRAIHRGLERSRSDTMDDASAPSTGVVPCLRR